MENTKVIIGLTNPQSPSNVGGVLRAAGCYQADKVCYTGVRYDTAMKFSSNTQKEGRNIPISWTEDFLSDLEEDVKIICVDFIEGAIPLPEFKHPEKAIYIFGAEDGTVLQDVIDKADAAVYVPTVGCMNLAASVNVLLYDRLAKSKGVVQGDDLIRSSRDMKNNRKFTK
ncbi:RNA methyltransferase [Fibrobacterales bacterium]|nr:RNA methyltransferase [Fibrobacterales bacterium]